MILPPTPEANKQRQFPHRLNILFFIIFILFAVLIVRLAMLQFVQGAELTEQKKERMMKDVPIAPIRGNIYDRQGQIIAESTSTQSLFFRIEPNTTQDEVLRLASLLAIVFAKYGDPNKPSLTPNDIVLAMEVGYDFNKKQVGNMTYTFYPRRIKTGLSRAEIAHFVENQAAYKGVEVIEESIREYDKTGIAVQLVGYLRNYGIARNTKSLSDYYGEAVGKLTSAGEVYLDTEDVGYDGLELVYQKELRGKNGMQSYPVNSREQIVGNVNIKRPVKGNNLYLTIDRNVQLAAEEAIATQLEYAKTPEARSLRYPYAPNAKTGYAVALEVDTGKVVAMASYPDYDPNVWRGGITHVEREANKFYFTNGTVSSARPNYPTDKEVGRHPTSIVPLGSTIKPLTVLLGLNEKLFAPGERYYDSGSFLFGRNKDSEVNNSDEKSYGFIDAADAIRVSSNTFMTALIGDRLYRKKNGLEIFDRYMKQFGLGTPTGSDLPNEFLGIRDYMAEAKKNSAQSALVYASFGQQGKYTTLQLAQFMATMATRGVRPKPLFVDKVTDYRDRLVTRPQAQVMNRVDIPEKYWEVVERGMRQVATVGNTAQVFAGFPYPIACKTGTSQSDIAGRILNNAVFVAYAPAEKPRLAVAVVVPEGNYGAWNAAPIARKIFDAYDLSVGLNGTPRVVMPEPLPATAEAIPGVPSVTP